MANMVNLTNMEDGKQMSKEPRSTRFVMMLTEGEERSLQAYRFRNHIGTKAEAARTLIAAGLREVATTGVKFGDPSPVEAETETVLETINARNT